MNADSKQISFITEGLPWKITVNNWSIQKNTSTTGTYKKERERRSCAFPSDSNPALPSPPLALEIGPPNPARGLGSAVSSPSGVWGQAPAEIEFGAF